MNLLTAREWSDSSGDSPAQLKDLEAVFDNLVNVILGFAGIALFIMLLVGGFQYMTAGGDPKKAEMAKKTLTSAIVGLVLIVLAYLILVIIGEVTGTSLTEFKIVN